MMATRRAAAIAAAAATCALALTACGDDSSSDSGVPDGAVAVIGETEVSKEDLAEQVTALRRSQPKPTEQQRELLAEDAKLRAQAQRQLDEQALSVLLMARAIEQEAKRRGVTVDVAEVRQRWEAVASQQFKTEQARKRFLGGQTEADVVEQLRLQALAERIHEQVAEEAGGGKKGQQAVKRFQREFQKRWQQQTTCAKDIDAAGCP